MYIFPKQGLPTKDEGFFKLQMTVYIVNCIPVPLKRLTSYGGLTSNKKSFLCVNYCSLIYHRGVKKFVSIVNMSF